MANCNVAEIVKSFQEKTSSTHTPILPTVVEPKPTPVFAVPTPAPTVVTPEMLKVMMSLMMASHAPSVSVPSIPAVVTTNPPPVVVVPTPPPPPPAPLVELTPAPALTVDSSLSDFWSALLSGSAAVTPPVVKPAPVVAAPAPLLTRTLLKTALADPAVFEAFAKALGI